MVKGTAARLHASNLISLCQVRIEGLVGPRQSIKTSFTLLCIQNIPYLGLVYVPFLIFDLRLMLFHCSRRLFSVRARFSGERWQRNTIWLKKTIKVRKHTIWAGKGPSCPPLWTPMIVALDTLPSLSYRIFNLAGVCAPFVAIRNS